MYCQNCKMIVNKNVNFCPCCGSKLVEETDEIREEMRQIEEMTPAYCDTYDAESYAGKRKMKSQTIAWISYLGILGIIFAFIKKDPDDELVKFHINQSIVLNAITYISLLLPIPDGLYVLIYCLALGAAIFGIYEAANKKQQGIPYISRIKLIK